MNLLNNVPVQHLPLSHQLFNFRTPQLIQRNNQTKPQ